MLIIHIKNNNIEWYLVTLHARLIISLLLKWLHWTKIFIRIPSKIFLQGVKWIYKKETFQNRFELSYIMGCIFDASRKVIKNFVSKIKQYIWKVVKSAFGVCKSELNLVWYYKSLIIIIYKNIFTLSFNIFCNSNKIFL